MSEEDETHLAISLMYFVSISFLFENHGLEILFPCEYLKAFEKMTFIIT